MNSGAQVGRSSCRRDEEQRGHVRPARVLRSVRVPERGLRGQPPTVAVVQTADSAASMDDRERAGTLLNGSARGSVLVDSEMSPVLVVVGPVFGK